MPLPLAPFLGGGGAALRFGKVAKYLGAGAGVGATGYAMMGGGAPPPASAPPPMTVPFDGGESLFGAPPPAPPAPAPTPAPPEPFTAYEVPEYGGNRIFASDLTNKANLQSWRQNQFGKAVEHYRNQGATTNEAFLRANTQMNRHAFPSQQRQNGGIFGGGLNMNFGGGGGAPQQPQHNAPQMLDDATLERLSQERQQNEQRYGMQRAREMMDQQHYETHNWGR